MFVATGNGNGNSSSDPEYGDTVVKLNASASPLDFWAPPNWQTLDSTDADLGSSLPTLLPGGYVFQSGKDGNGYLVNGASLGHVSAPAREVAGLCSGGSFGGSVYDPANSTLYVTCSGGLKALTLTCRLSALAHGQSRIRRDLLRHRAADDRGRPRLEREPLERNALRARPHHRRDEEPLLDSRGGLGRQPLRHPERRRRAGCSWPAAIR